MQTPFGYVIASPGQRVLGGDLRPNDWVTLRGVQAAVAEQQPMSRLIKEAKARLEGRD